VSEACVCKYHRPASLRKSAGMASDALSAAATRDRVARMTSKEAAIKGVPLFAKCSKGEIELVAKLADEIDLPAGKTLMREGETGREFFIILDGTAEVRRGDELLATLGPGGFCGEMALVDQVPRMATVTATTPIDVLVLTGQGFSGLRGRLPNMDQTVLDEIAERVRANAEQA
jgi:CRP-like cAMP-binding protein